MLFQGEEFATRTPFLYFCDFEGELATAVREGRRREFSCFGRFSDPAARAQIPDPNADETFHASKLNWGETALDGHRAALEHHRRLIAIRKRDIVPHIAGRAHSATFETLGAAGLAVDWVLGDGARLHLRANFGDAPLEGVARPAGIVLHGEGDPAQGNGLGPWSGIWSLEPA